jgi:small redox-active disulfide protein 2
MIIKVLGSGCANCVKLEENAKLAVKELGLEAEFIKVKDMEGIASYGIMRTPGLVVDEKVVSYGKVLTADQIKPLLTK